MNLLTYAAKRFSVPLTHTVTHGGRSDEFPLTGIRFTNRQLVAVYGDEDNEFEVIIRGES